MKNGIQVVCPRCGAEKLLQIDENQFHCQGKCHGDAESADPVMAQAKKFDATYFQAWAWGKHDIDYVICVSGVVSMKSDEAKRLQNKELKVKIYLKEVKDGASHS
jgi:hypothetical protein